MSDDPGWDAIVVGAAQAGPRQAYGLCKRGRSVLLIDAGPRFDPSSTNPLTEPIGNGARIPHKRAATGKAHSRRARNSGANRCSHREAVG